MTQNLGEFEQIVLLAILRLGNEAYTVPVIDEIEGRTGRQVAHAAVYTALRRLENKGLVASRLGDPVPARGGRARRLFTVSREAFEQLVEQRDALLAMWDGVGGAAS